MPKKIGACIMNTYHYFIMDTKYITMFSCLIQTKHSTYLYITFVHFVLCVMFSCDHDNNNNASDSPTEEVRGSCLEKKKEAKSSFLSANLPKLVLPTSSS